MSKKGFFSGGRLEQLDRIVPLVGLGVAAYAAGRAAAARRAVEEQLAAANGAAPPPPALPPAATPAPAAAAAHPSRKKLSLAKKFLVFAMLVGIVALVVGSSTFATFTAETGNPGSTVAAGTLTLSDQVNTGTVCDSYGAGVNGNAVNSNDNYNANCAAVLTLANMSPGVTSGQSKVTIKNTGSIAASLFSVFAPYVNGSLSTQVNSGAMIGTGQTVTSFSVSSLEGPISTNDKIFLYYGTTTQQFCAGGNVSPSSTTTSIPISGGYALNTTGACPGTSGPIAAVATFPIGTRLDDTSSNSSPSNTDCYDSYTTAPGVTGATYGNLNFNSPSGNPFCQTALMWIQEQSTVGGNTYNYCWFGRGASGGDQSGGAEDANGQCRTPTTATLSGTLSTGGAITSLPVTALTGNVTSGDSIVLTEGSNTQTFTASGQAFIGDTSIPVTSLTPNYAYTSAATVKDTTAFTALNGDNHSSTISNFDTAHLSTGPIYMAPLTGNGTANTGATVQLARHGDANGQDTRIFYIGVYFPAPAGTPQNSIQALMSTFGISFHIDQ